MIEKKQDLYDLAFFPYLELTPHFSTLPKLSEKGIEVEEDTKFIYENSEEDENSTLYEVINSIIRIKKEIRYLEYKLD
ncbi:hypothetical protein [Metamycoplasma hominis]|uniref:hypothetical protein n=1 Tax=Metamycoplasma hominis TaxID=2098 RepID=UPI003CF5C8E4